MVWRRPPCHDRRVDLPADSHVHSEWSWDTGGPHSDAAGRMELVCARAVAIGLPAVIFTEHFDLDPAWRSGRDEMVPHLRSLISDDGYVVVPPFDLDGYLESIDRCRRRFPEVRILTGLEYGQPHLNDARAAQLLDLTAFDRVNGSLHTLPFGDVPGDRAEPNTLMLTGDPTAVMEAYLDELPRMVAGSDTFAVVTHIDYAVREWPSATAGPFDPRRFEDGFRAAMRAIAAADRALEMNTRRLWSWMPQWWAEEGGRAVTFGSDAHVPELLANGFPEATAMLEHYGFRPGSAPEDFWTR